jgi:hypothetical protein
MRRARTGMAAALAAALGGWALAAVGCGGGGGGGAGPPAAGDGGAGDGPSGPLGLTLEARMDPAPIYPWDPAVGEHRVTLRYRVLVASNGRELQDLEVRLPTPVNSPDSVTVSGGWYGGAQGSARRVVDWLPPEQGPIATDVTFQRNPHIFSEDPRALKGDLELSTAAQVLQYGEPLATSAPVTRMAYFPARVGPAELDMASGQVDGGYLYLAARPRAGEHAGRAGVYRMQLADGAVTPVAQHQARTDMLPFVVDGDRLLFVTYVMDGMPPVLMARNKDGSGVPATIPLPPYQEIRGVAVDASHLYVPLRTAAGMVLFRCRKDDPTQEARSSDPFGATVSDTIAVAPAEVVLMQESPGALLRIAKGDLTVHKLVDVASNAGPRTLACSATSCFWTEWTEGGIYQTPLPAGGARKKISGSNQPFHYDGKHLYSGINGLIRAAPGATPPEQRLFQGGVLPVFGSDGSHVYFGHESRVWRLHK